MNTELKKYANVGGVETVKISELKKDMIVYPIYGYYAGKKGNVVKIMPDNKTVEVVFKHKVGMTENEVSRRYVSDTPSVYFPRWRGKPTNGAKQGSEDFMPIDDDYNTVNRHYEFTVREALLTYDELLKRGVAPEQARAVLPQATYTEWWWTGSLSAFARVYTQRSDPHAQWECQEYAKAISTIIQPLFPQSWNALTGT